jgi:hypothetical protein
MYEKKKALFLHNAEKGFRFGCFYERLFIPQKAATWYPFPIGMDNNNNSLCKKTGTLQQNVCD